MNFGLTEEQIMLTDAIKRYLESASTINQIRDYVGPYGASQARKEDREVPDPQQFERFQNGYMESCRQGLVELGIPGALVPEDFGGLGLNMLDAALIAEQLGYHAACVPFIGSNVLAPLAITLAGSDEQKQQFLPAIAEGEARIGVGLSEHASYNRSGATITSQDNTLNGQALFVLDFAATAYIVADSNGVLWLVAADAQGLEKSVTETVDLTRTTGDLTLNNVQADKLSGSSPAVMQKLIDTARVMLAADSLGAAQSLFDKTIVYTGDRVQFGRPIASFQAVKHICAEMIASLEPCRAMMWYAAHSLDHLPDEATAYAARAKAHIAEVALFVSRKSIEMHGGMGFTDLTGLHYWFKRIGASRQYQGSPTQLRQIALQQV